MRQPRKIAAAGGQTPLASATMDEPRPAAGFSKRGRCTSGQKSRRRRADTHRHRLGEDPAAGSPAKSRTVRARGRVHVNRTAALGTMARPGQQRALSHSGQGQRRRDLVHAVTGRGVGGHPVRTRHCTSWHGAEPVKRASQQGSTTHPAAKTGMEPLPELSELRRLHTGRAPRTERPLQKARAGAVGAEGALEGVNRLELNLNARASGAGPVLLALAKGRRLPWGGMAHRRNTSAMLRSQRHSSLGIKRSRVDGGRGSDNAAHDKNKVGGTRAAASEGQAYGQRRGSLLELLRGVGGCAEKRRTRPSSAVRTASQGCT
jgi:hypothetical protein